MVTEDSFLQQIKVPIYWPNSMSQELCGLFGTWIWDNKDRLPSLCGHLTINTCSSFMGTPKAPGFQAVTLNILRVTTDLEAWGSGCSPKSCQGEACIVQVNTKLSKMWLWLLWPNVLLWGKRTVGGRRDPFDTVARTSLQRLGTSSC